MPLNSLTTQQLLGEPMNKRRRTRVESIKDATLSFSKGSIQGRLLNISLKGCLIEPNPSESIPNSGEKLSICIHLEPNSEEFDIDVNGKTIRATPRKIAVEFLEIPPESFQRLLRFIQYNASDPDAIENELGSSVFDPRNDTE